MKKLIIYCIQGSFVAIVCMSLIFKFDRIIENDEREVSKEKPKEVIPDFAFKDLNGEFFSSKNLPECSAYLFIYFNSECSNCEVKLKKINQVASKFTNTQLLFVSNQEKDDLQEVYEQYDMFKLDNIVLLQDYNFDFQNQFDATYYPTFLIYDQNRQLVRRIDDRIDIPTLIKITRFAYFSS